MLRLKIYKSEDSDNRIWACGGMVDTLVLGTSANAWEFESLHAHHFQKTPRKGVF